MLNNIKTLTDEQIADQIASLKAALPGMKNEPPLFLATQKKIRALTLESDQRKGLFANYAK